MTGFFPCQRIIDAPNSNGDAFAVGGFLRIIEVEEGAFTEFFQALDADADGGSVGFDEGDDVVALTCKGDGAFFAATENERTIFAFHDVFLFHSVELNGFGIFHADERSLAIDVNFEWRAIIVGNNHRLGICDF